MRSFCNAEKRPIAWTNGTVSLEMSYDYMGRRIAKKSFENNVLVSSEKFIYDGYLQVATLNSTNEISRLIYWDPSETIATRPLMISLANSETFFPTVDLNKNVCELIDANLAIATTYDYTPFGSVSISGNHSTPFQFSSEFFDSELGLVYYNYRHYNPTDGRWINRDNIGEYGGVNLYGFINNTILARYDTLGQKCEPISSPFQGYSSGWFLKSFDFDKQKANLHTFYEGLFFEWAWQGEVGCCCSWLLFFKRYEVKKIYKTHKNYGRFDPPIIIKDPTSPPALNVPTPTTISGGVGEVLAIELEEILSNFWGFSDGHKESIRIIRDNMVPDPYVRSMAC